MLNFSQFQTSSVIGVSAVSTTFDDDVIDGDDGDDDGINYDYDDVCDDFVPCSQCFREHP